MVASSTTSPITGTDTTVGTPVSMCATPAMPDRSAAMLNTLATSSSRHAT